MYRLRRWGPGLLLVSPTLIILAILVYGFLGRNVQVSLSNWRGLRARYDYVGFDYYTRLFHDDRFIQGVKNLTVFTLIFVFGALLFGFFLALLLERGVRAEGLFRGIFLFPMAISFIATAVVWRWLMSNARSEERRVGKEWRAAGAQDCVESR